MHLNEVIPKNCTLGAPASVHGLGVIPISSGTVPEIPDPDILDSALKVGTLKITEVSEGGTVPFLRGENTGAHP